MRVSLPCLCLLTFSLSSQAYAEGFYLKLDFPVGMELIDSKSAQNLSSDDIHRKSGALKPTFLTQLGVGYKFSDYFEAELMYGQLGYNFAADTIITKLNYATSPLGHDLFGFAFNGTPGTFSTPYCTNNPALFVTTDEICGMASVFSSGITSLKTSTKFNNLVGAVKYMPIKEVYKMFSPYVSLGAGISHSSSKFSYSFYSVPAGTIQYPSGKKTTSALALEFGVGTKVKVAKNFHLDVSAKYYDYGNHKLAPTISKKVKGYKFSVGATFLLDPIKP